MRLRYLHIPDLAPLKNITITFGHEPILGRECTIHFIVGVNGTGKSRLLRAVAEIFLSLETGDVPPFPVTIAYDLGKHSAGEQEESQSQRTVYYRYTGGGMASAYMVELKPIPLDAENIAWEHFHEIDWEKSDHPLKLKRQYYGGNDSAIKSYLPTFVLAYTSGAPDEWETTFTFPARDLEENFELPPVEQDQEIRGAMEYSPKWNSYKRAVSQQVRREENETKHSLQSQGKELFPGENLFPAEGLFPGGGRSSGIGIFVQPQMLKLVICAVALSQALEEFEKRPTEADREGFAIDIENAIKNKQRMGGLRDLLNEVDWFWHVTIGLRIAFRTEQFNKEQLKLLTRLYTIATSVVRASQSMDKSMDRRTLFFDLLRRLRLENYRKYEGKSTLEAVSEIIGGGSTQAFAIFKQLFELQQQGILEDITIVLQKRNLGKNGKKGVLLYDWLSDGERVFLGRMALFHLLKGIDDTLIILDEPETHFNDVWKREVTDIIDQSLQNSSSEVVLATHSSIALSDAFDNEITVLHKNARTGNITARRPAIRSFGASPNEILRDVFNAPETVGQRASEFLNLMLLIATYSAQARAIWTMSGSDDEIYSSTTFRRLSRVIVARMNEDGEGNTSPDSQKLFNQHLLHTLRSVRDYTEHHTGKREVDVADVLDILQDRLGPGYYQFEFRRRLNALLERRGPDAP